MDFNAPTLIMMVVLWGIWGLAMGTLAVRAFRNRYGKVKTVKAQVVDKFVEDNVSKIYGSMAKPAVYYVVFEFDGKRRSFQVSSFSYQGYRLKEKGTLRYRGRKIISFSQGN